MQAARAGASDQQLEMVERFEEGPFSEAEKAALEYAKSLTLDARSIDDGLFARLRSFYDEGEIVEITAIAGLFNYFNRVNDALRMQPTAPGDGL